MTTPAGWQGILDDGERILWQGRPDPAVLAIGLPAVPLLTLMMANEAVTRGLGRVLLGQTGQLVLRPLAQLVLLAALLAALGDTLSPAAAMATLSLSALAGWLVSARVRARAVAPLPAARPVADLARRRGLQPRAQLRHRQSRSRPPGQLALAPHAPWQSRRPGWHQLCRLRYRQRPLR